MYSGDGGKTWQPYDLSVDVAEANDIAAKNDPLVKQMVQAVTAWQASCKASDAGEDYR